MALNDQVLNVVEDGIVVPDPRDPNKTLKVKVDKAYILPKILNHQTNDLYDYVYAILGDQPPVNNIGYHEADSNEDYSFGGLNKYEFCFTGVKRPCKRVGEDANIIILILKPKFRYAYTPNMVCAAKIEAVPDDLGFAVYLRQTLENNAKIVKWEWIECGEDGKPLDHQNRYNEEL